MSEEQTRIGRRFGPLPTPSVQSACLVLRYAPGEAVPVGRRFNLHPVETSIGRDPANTLALTGSDTVSRFHARITFAAGRFEIADLHSTNGTFVGDDDAKLQTLRNGDVVRFGRTSFRFLCGPQVEVSHYEEIQALASSEPRTGVANSRRLGDCVASELARFNAHGGGLSLVSIRVDQIADIESRYGALARDQVLREVARRVRPLCRVYELLALDEADNFVLVLPGTIPELALRPADQARLAVRAEPVLWGGERIVVSASVGVAGMEPGTTEVSGALAAAGAALLDASAGGGDRVSLLDATIVDR